MRLRLRSYREKGDSSLIRNDLNLSQKQPRVLCCPLDVDGEREPLKRAACSFVLLCEDELSRVLSEKGHEMPISASISFCAEKQ